MNVACIERSIKRTLSAAELAAIEKVIDHLPTDRRKQKRMLRIARERARKAEVSVKAQETRREPTDQQLRAAKRFFKIWQKPSLFIGEVERLARSVPTAKLWGNRYKFLREAITLAEFCKHCEVLAVRLGDDPPDACVRLNLDEDTPFEITEVQEPGRKRGDEYQKLGVQAGTFVPDDQVAARTETMLKALKDGIAAKAVKYDFKPRLLVYLNFPHDRRAEPEIRETIVELQNTFSGQLSGIHVVTDRILIA
jgi:hypothetical protein